MAGLNSLISDVAEKQTTLPSWYDAAQQNLVSQATTAANAAVAPSATVGQQAVNTMTGPNNPFQQAQSTLGQISSGAANPWLVSSTGQVTPNVNTALGGLFQAQNQQLQQMVPNLTATPNAASIGTGQFGGLRNQTAANKAVADAQANLFASQMQSALQNQSTGINAASALGNVGQQGIENAINVGNWQQNAAFNPISNYGKILGSVQAPQSVSETMQYAPLTQIGSLLSLLGSQGSGTGILGNDLVSGLLGKATTGASNLLDKIFTSSNT